MYNFQGKRALVTGAGRGMTRAVSCNIEIHSETGAMQGAPCGYGNVGPNANSFDDLFGRLPAMTLLITLS